MTEGRKIAVGVAGIGAEILCAAAVALKAPKPVWIFLLVIGALLIIAAFAVGESDEEDSEVRKASAAGGSGDGHIRGNVIGDHATITISEVSHVSPTSDNKTLVRISVRELTQIYKDHTQVQAERLIEPYIGGWLRVTGPVSDVTKVVWTDGGYRVVLDISDDLVSATFHQEWQEQLPRLRRGDEITLVGKIAQVGSYGVELESSELVEADS